MTEPQDPAVVLIAALIAEDRLTKANLDKAIRERDAITNAAISLEKQLLVVTWERDELAATCMKMDVELIDAGGTIQTLEDRLAAAYRDRDAAERKLQEWEAAADTLGPVGLVMGDPS